MGSTISSAWQFLNGKKTYILTGATIVVTWLQVWNGTVDSTTAFYATAAALGFSTVRHGVAKQSQPSE